MQKCKSGSNGIFIQDLNEALIDFDNTNMPKVESRPLQIYTAIYPDFSNVCSKFLNDMSSHIWRRVLYLDSQVSHDNVNDHWNHSMQLTIEC